MLHTTCELLPDDAVYYCHIPNLPGVWASGATLEAAREELQEALEDWIAVGLSLGHTIPVIDGIDINVRVTS